MHIRYNLKFCTPRGYGGRRRRGSFEWYSSFHDEWFSGEWSYWRRTSRTTYMKILWMINMNPWQRWTSWWMLGMLGSTSMRMTTLIKWRTPFPFWWTTEPDKFEISRKSHGFAALVCCASIRWANSYIIFYKGLLAYQIEHCETDTPCATIWSSWLFSARRWLSLMYLWPNQSHCHPLIRI